MINNDYFLKKLNLVTRNSFFTQVLSLILLLIPLRDAHERGYGVSPEQVS